MDSSDSNTHEGSENSDNERQLLDCFSDIATDQVDVFSLISSVEASPQKQSTSETTNVQQQFDLTTLLYPSAAITQFQSLILLLLYVIRNALSGKAITELLQLFKVHLQPGARLPSTVHTLRQYFIRAYPECKGEIHVYCNICHHVIPTGGAACDVAGCEQGKPDYFICSRLDLQVKRLMEGTFTIIIRVLHVHVSCACMFHSKWVSDYTSYMETTPV